MNFYLTINENGISSIKTEEKIVNEVSILGDLPAFKIFISQSRIGDIYDYKGEFKIVKLGDRIFREAKSVDPSL